MHPDTGRGSGLCEKEKKVFERDYKSLTGKRVFDGPHGNAEFIIIAFDEPDSVSSTRPMKKLLTGLFPAKSTRPTAK